MNKRDRAIAERVLERVGLKGEKYLHRVTSSMNSPTGRIRLPEVHWLRDFRGFRMGGSFQPVTRSSYDAFVAECRTFTYEDYHDHLHKLYDNPVTKRDDPFEDYRFWLFSIDLERWTLCPADEALCEAKRRHPAFLERWFALFHTASPSAELLDTLTRDLCRHKELPYPGPLTFSVTQIFPAEPTPDPVVPCAIRRGIITAAGIARPTHKRPEFAEDEFLESVREVRSTDHRKLRDPMLALWWLGQSTFLLSWKGRFMLLDPCLSSAVSSGTAGSCVWYPQRLGPLISPKHLDFLDIVACSCDRPDHFNPDTLRALVEVNPRLRIVCPAAHQELVRDTTGLSQDRITGVELTPGESPGSRFSAHPKAKMLGIRFIPVPAVREDSPDPAPDARPDRIGYLIHTGVCVIYLPGCTRPDGETVETLRHWEPQLALLPINGREPDDAKGNYWGDEAAQLAKDIQAEIAIPCHYDLCNEEAATTDEFIAACRALHQDYHLPRHGERVTIKFRA